MCCKNCCNTIKDEPLKVGDTVGYRRHYNGTRIGGAEPKTIEYISEHTVVYSVMSAKGESLGEHSVRRDAFNDEFERVEY